MIHMHPHFAKMTASLNYWLRRPAIMAMHINVTRSFRSLTAGSKQYAGVHDWFGCLCFCEQRVQNIVSCAQWMQSVARSSATNVMMNMEQRMPTKHAQVRTHICQSNINLCRISLQTQLTVCFSLSVFILSFCFSSLGAGTSCNILLGPESSLTQFRHAAVTLF